MGRETQDFDLHKRNVLAQVLFLLEIGTIAAGFMPRRFAVTVARRVQDRQLHTMPAGSVLIDQKELSSRRAQMRS